MTYQQVATMVSTIGVPYAYYQFPEGTAQATPFVCFYFSDSNDMYADDLNYRRIRTLVIELYTDNKNFALEATVEAKLNANGLTYARSESWIDSEHMNMAVFTADVIITS